MDDIVSNLCELPTGVYSLEFLPRTEITSWENGMPFPRYRWYGIGVYRDSLTFKQPTEATNQGPITSVSVGCLVITDDQKVADLLESMERHRFVLRVTHYDGKKRIVGTEDQFCSLVNTQFEPSEVVGAQGYSLNFAGQFTRRPLVVG